MSNTIAQQEIDRVLRSTRVDGLHLIWTGKIQDGVPTIGAGGTTKTVRRHLWSLTHAEEDIPHNRVVKAGCGVLNCVAPEHLELGKKGGRNPVMPAETTPTPSMQLPQRIPQAADLIAVSPHRAASGPRCQDCGGAVVVPAYLANNPHLRCDKCRTLPDPNSPEALALADAVANGVHEVTHLPEAEVRRLRAGEATAAARKPVVVKPSPLLEGVGWEPAKDPHAVETLIDESRVAECPAPETCGDYMSRLKARMETFRIAGEAVQSQRDRSAPFAVGSVPVHGPANGVGAGDTGSVPKAAEGAVGPPSAPPDDDAPAGPRLFVAIVRSLLVAGVDYPDLSELLYATHAAYSVQTRIEGCLR